MDWALRRDGRLTALICTISNWFAGFDRRHRDSEAAEVSMFPVRQHALSASQSSGACTRLDERKRASRFKASMGVASLHELSPSTDHRLNTTRQQDPQAPTSDCAATLICLPSRAFCAAAESDPSPTITQVNALRPSPLPATTVVPDEQTKCYTPSILVPLSLARPLVSVHDAMRLSHYTGGGKLACTGDMVSDDESPSYAILFLTQDES